MNADKIKHLADEVLRPFLDNVGFVDVDVHEERNEEGADELLLTLHFIRDAKLASGAALLNAQVSIQEALEARGEPRFPHFRYDYPDDPPPFDEDDAYGVP